MNRFATDCGHPSGIELRWRPVASGDAAPEQDQQIEDASAEWQSVQTPLPYALIGGCKSCLVAVPEADAVAAYVQALEGRVFVCFLGGKLDERQESAWLFPGETFTVGSREFVVEFPDGDASNESGGEEDGTDAKPQLVDPSEGRQPSWDSDPADDDLAAILVTLRNGHRRGRPLRSVRGVTVIGRRPGCKFQVVAPSVAPAHCSLVRTRRSLWLVDLASGRGTRVSGQRVKHAPLEKAVEIQLGHMRLGIETLTHRETEDTALDDAEPPRPHAATNGTLPAPVDDRNERDAQSGEAGGLVRGRDVDGERTELVTAFLDEMSSSQQQMMDQTYDLFAQLIASQQQTSLSHLEVMRQQNEQLMEVVKSLADAKRQPTEVVVKVDNAAARLNAAGLAGGGPTGRPQPPAQNLQPPQSPPQSPQQSPPEPRRDVPPPDADPEVRNAWVRSQLHEISEEIQTKQKRGLTKLLGKLFSRDDDALQ